MPLAESRSTADLSGATALPPTIGVHVNAMHISKVQDANVQTDKAEEYKAPTEETAWSRIKKALGPIAVVGVVIAKFLAKVKFVLPILLKSGGTMLLMVWVYMQLWGWQFALGFVLLLLVHETGHLIVAKRFGLKVGAPVFIPFMGAQRMDGSVRGYWRAVAGEFGCAGVQRVGRILRCSDFYRARVVRLFSELIQPHPGWNARRRTHRDGVVALVVVTRIWVARVVWMEISKLHYLADCPLIAAAGLLVVPQTHRRRAALFRSHTVAALDNVDLIFWPDRAVALRNARGSTRSTRVRRAGARTRTRHHRAITHSTSNGFPGVQRTARPTGRPSENGRARHSVRAA